MTSENEKDKHKRKGQGLDYGRGAYSPLPADEKDDEKADPPVSPGDADGKHGQRTDRDTPLAGTRKGPAQPSKP